MTRCEEGRENRIDPIVTQNDKTIGSWSHACRLRLPDLQRYQAEGLELRGMARLESSSKNSFMLQAKSRGLKE